MRNLSRDRAIGEGQSQDDMAQRLGVLEQSLASVRHCDRVGVAKTLSRLSRRLRRKQAIDRGLAELERVVQHSCSERQRRCDQRLQINYPEALPVSHRVADIQAALREHQVVVVAGETGSGKTTQLPKMLLEAGFGVDGDIACTQPRRIAARSIAARLAEETDTELGGLIGYQVRFDERCGEHTRVRLMTDGMLLASIARDRRLDRFDALIIDEAHERSLNIDFLLGYLKQILPQRPQLRVVITSATIDTDRFARHFDDAPVITVTGRSYPVELRYRPPKEKTELAEAVASALTELDRTSPRGDVLVFLPTERSIVEVQRHLERHYPGDDELLPLFGRLSPARQQKVFHPGSRRRVVLATNIAETSLTVPRIHCVIDSGLARLSRYSPRSKVQRLPIEAIAQAGANQRKGRCGRLGPGICIRLYSEEDFLQRPEYTEPELLRSSLASVILQMKSLALGEIEDFGFLEPPSPRQISDGYRLLDELDALDAEGRMTATGRQMARLPLDVRIARMLVAAEQQGCLDAMLVIAAAMSVPDIREQTDAGSEEALALRQAIADEQSDFVLWLRLWAEIAERGRSLSGNRLKRWMREAGLHVVRWLEWRDVHSQLRRHCSEMGWQVSARVPDPEDTDHRRLHTAMLQGLLGHIGQREQAVDYQGARGRGFSLSPASGLRKRPPKWLVAGELIETHRVLAHTGAAVRPEWIEQAAGRRLKRSYSDAHWVARSGRVMAEEQVSLYGLVLASGRKVHYGPIDPVLSRRLMIEHALVAGESTLEQPFLSHNRALIRDIRYLEDKQRRHDLLVSESELADFYDERLPADVFTSKALIACLKRGGRELQQRLSMQRQDVLRQGAELALAAYPDEITLAEQRFAVSYRFQRGADDDGMSVQVPLAELNRLNPARLEWLVPGMLEEKVTALIRGLPKRQRRHFVPVPDFARAFVEATEASDRYLLPVLSDHLHRMTGVSIAAQDWENVSLEPHLLARIVLLDEQGRVMDQGRDLGQLQQRHGQRARRHFRAHLGSGFHRDDIREWDFGALPEQVEAGESSAFPALIRQAGGDVSLRLFETRGRALAAMESGLAALLGKVLRDKCRFLARELMPATPVQLAFARLGSPQQLRDDCLQASLAEVCRQFAAVPRDQSAFAQLVEFARTQLGPVAVSLAKQRDDMVLLSHQIHQALSRAAGRWPRAVEDLRQQLDALMRPDFLCYHPVERLLRLPCYLQAMQHRIERLSADPKRDARQMDVLEPLLERLQAARERVLALPPSLQESLQTLDVIAWRIEEFRVSLFAQHLGAAEKVSAKRLAAEIEAALRS